MGRDRLLGIILAVFGVAGSVAVPQLLTDPEWSASVFYGSLLVTGLSLLSGLVILLWPGKSSDPASGAAPTMTNERKGLFDQSTNVGDNNRGIVAPVYNNVINQAPPPRVEWGPKQIAELGGRYKTMYDFQVVVPYPVKSMFIEAYGKNVRDLSAQSQSVGIQMVGWSGVRETHAFTTLQHAQGNYRLEFTSDNPDVEVKYGFDD